MQEAFFIAVNNFISEKRVRSKMPRTRFAKLDALAR